MVRGCSHGSRLPTALRLLWTIWLAAVSINVVVWALVSATHGHLAYPWPVWVAGPYGGLCWPPSRLASGQHDRPFGMNELRRTGRGATV